MEGVIRQHKSRADVAGRQTSFVMPDREAASNFPFVGWRK